MRGLRISFMVSVKREFFIFAEILLFFSSVLNPCKSYLSLGSTGEIDIPEHSIRLPLTSARYVIKWRVHLKKFPRNLIFMILSLFTQPGIA